VKRSDIFIQSSPSWESAWGIKRLDTAFGGEVVRAERIRHGKTSLIFHDGRTIYSELPNPFEAVRYHSLILNRKELPECLEISA